MKILGLDLGRVFSPATMERAFKTLDQHTLLIVSVCWSAALVMVLLAVLGVHTTLKAKKELAEAMAKEPELPKVEFTAVKGDTLKPIGERLIRRYPGLKIEWRADGTLLVASESPDNFRRWTLALNYVDSISPELRWNIRTLCVGECEGGVVMTAMLKAENVTFTDPTSSAPAE